MATRTGAKRKGKTTAKTTAVIGELIPQPHGGALRNGGPNKGGTGRPKKAFKKFCRELVSSPEYQAAITRAATNDQHKEFVGAAKLAASFAASKPPKKVEHLHTHTARSRLATRLARIVERN